MKKAYLFLVRNWKTTIVGILTSLLTYLLSNGTISKEQFELSLGILVAVGYVLTKDGDVSTPTKPVEETPVINEEPLK